MERAIVSLAAEQQPRAAQKEALVSERESARRAAAQREAEVEVKLREAQQLQDQLAAKVRGGGEYVCIARRGGMKLMEGGHEVDGGGASTAG